jgi:hypothetical protein
MSTIEIWFCLGGLLMTCIVGAVLVPVLKKALAEDRQQDGDK